MSRAEQVMDPLLAAVVHAQYGMTRQMTERVLDDREAEILRLKATLYLIRDDIEDITTGPYIASPSYIRERLWPSEARIEERMAYEKGMNGAR